MPSMPTNFRQFNINTRLIDNFYASFFRLPENASNILGANLKRMTRPRLEFEIIETKMNRSTFVDKQQIRMSEVQFIFFDDEDSVVSTLLHVQMLRQMNKHYDVMNQYGDFDQRDYRFDVRCDILNSKEMVVEQYILKNCLLTGIEYTEGNYGDDTQSEITVGVRFDDIEIVFNDEVLPLLKLTPRANH